MRASFAGAILLFFIFSLSHAQEIQVLEQTSNEPIRGVAVFNADKSRSTITDLYGVANISRFKDSEMISFKHMSHKLAILSKAEILANNNRVYLEGDENQLEQVVLSAGRFKMSKEETTQKIVALNSHDVQLYAPQTSADLLEGSGQVFVQKSQMGGGSPMIRGFSANRLLITVDGVRMNTAIFRSGNLQNVISVDPLAVENTEVIIGPGSVVYGSDAVGGVMNFYTLKPKFSAGKTGFSGNAYTRYATANNEKTIHADFNIGRENWAFLTGVTYSDFEDLRMGSNGPEEYLRPDYVIRRGNQDVVVENSEEKLQKFTGYDQINLLQKIKYMPGNDWDFNLGLIYSTTSDFPRYDRLIQKRNGEFRSAEWYYGPQTWFMGNFKINKKGNGILYDKAQLTTAYQFFEESRNNRDFNEEIRFNSTEKVDAYSANLDFEKDFEESRLFYGTEYVYNLVNSSARQFNIISEETRADASRYPDASTWQSLAAYLSYQWKINSELSFQSGARYNHILVDAEFDEHFFDFPFSEANINTGALTGSVGLNWRQSRFFRWKLNLSTAFRAPNIDDVGKIFDSEPGAVVVPNPNLKPEYAYNSELGLDWMPSENLEFSFATYYTRLKDAMVRRDFQLDGKTEIDYQGEPSRVQAIQNAAKAYVYGFEAGVAYNISVALRLSSQINYTKGEEEQEDGSTVALRHAAPLFGNTHLTWHKKRLKFDVFAEYNGQIEYENLAPSEKGKAYLYALDENGNPYSPSWYTLNLSGQYEISEALLATISFENITDQRYRTYSSGIAAAGRNLILAIKYSF
ncbi:TonB-dependent receptor plug domain-containing protein [Salegentibacter sediminis]|uniref:TonB-dependent receptor plug domain-containing protein n=1 Tax=Salegentibacter sediminis TaxID=1930251 RepID=UPI0009C10665|nr:TonB-dependent receptor [Salegentibacter sediminis]